MTPADLLTDKSCRPACLLASTRVERCRCICEGAHHGLLAAVDITAVIDGRRAGLHLLTDMEVMAG